MEKLVALCCLWAFGLGAKEDYSAELDRLFLENPEDNFLLELECLGGDRAAALHQMTEPLVLSLNVDVFGKELFAALEKVYCENRLPLAEFGGRCYEIWNWLPYPYIHNCNEPFHTLCYGDDPLSYGDEAQSRRLYEAAFDYYKERK